MIDLKANPELLTTSPGGISCIFIPVDSQWAMKCYKTEMGRDEAFEYQTRAAEYGLAPLTNGTFEVEFDSHVNLEFAKFYTHRSDYNSQTAKKIYGYMTEIVRPVLNYKYYNPERGQEKSGDYMERVERRFRYRTHKLEKALNKCCGFYFGDNHGGNLGIKNGKLVCIDFL